MCFDHTERKKFFVLVIREDFLYVGYTSVDRLNIRDSILVTDLCMRYSSVLLYRREFSCLLKKCRNEEDSRTLRHFYSKTRLLFQMIFGSCCLRNLLYCLRYSRAQFQGSS